MKEEKNASNVRKEGKEKSLQVHLVSDKNGCWAGLGGFQAQWEPASISQHNISAPLK